MKISIFISDDFFFFFTNTIGSLRFLKPLAREGSYV